MKTGTALLLGGAAYTYIKQNYPDANSKLAYRANSENIAYMRERDGSFQKLNEVSLDVHRYENSENRFWQAEQARLDRLHDSYEASEQRYHEREMQKANIELRESELEVQREDISARMHTAELNAMVALRNADLDRETRLAMHSKEMDQQLIMQARELDQQEQLELRKLRVQRNLAEREEELQKYLFTQGVKSKQEIERFKALAIRETQILLARENAQNTLQDKMVQDALKTFPLNISPLVLLKNRPHSLTSLLRFSTSDSESLLLPDVSNVYQEVAKYSSNPEALNIFIAPIHISSSVKNRDELSHHIWDQIYNKVESFFTTFYNRRGDHPVIIYPTAWKDSSEAGQHASETLHFFLRDMPCMVLEPRFDGHSLSLIISGWNNGYLSSDHVRTQMSFDVNLDTLIAESTYARSKISLQLLKKIEDKASPAIKAKMERLRHNVEYYELLGIDEKIRNNDYHDINELNIHEIFDIDFSHDLQHPSSVIAAIICVNLAVLADVHHIQATDALPLFTKIFKENFQDLYENKELRELIFSCYEKVYLYLRNQEGVTANPMNRREMERVRELQIENIRKELELIDEKEIKDSIESRLKDYMQEKGLDIDIPEPDVWKIAVESMTIEDIPFFQQILPNINDRRMFKRIDKKISELLNNN